MSETTSRTVTWSAVSASRRGSAHAEDVPNQDAVLVRQVPSAAGDLWVAAVADGHGGARYVRSDLGARTAVELAVEVAVEVVCAALEDGDHPPQTPQAALRAAVPEVVAAWRESVVAHVRDHPLTPEELARGATAGPTAYGATLLLAVVSDHGVAIAQVGDGDALVRSHGFATRPVPGDDRLVAGETTSLCLDTAVDDFRYAVVPASADPDLVLLATDGYGNSFARADWWHGLVDDVAAFVGQHDVEQLGEQLPGWLEESARVGGDDVTAVLLVRDPLVDSPRREVAPPAPVGPSGHGDRPGRVDKSLAVPPARTRELADDAGRATAVVRERRAPARARRGAIAALAAAAVAIAVAAAVVLLGNRTPDVPETPSQPSTSTTPTGTSTPTTGDGAGKRREGERTPGGRGSTGPGDPEQKPPGSAEEEAEEEEPPAAPQRPG